MRFATIGELMESANPITLLDRTIHPNPTVDIAQSTSAKDRLLDAPTNQQGMHPVWLQDPINMSSEGMGQHICHPKLEKPH